MLLLALICSLLISSGTACSYVEVPVPDKDAPNGTKFVIGRTNELGNDLGFLEYAIRVHPRGENGGRYGFVSVDGHDAIRPIKGIWVVGDGMNEVGLSGGIQSFRESVYQGLIVKDKEKDALAQELLGSLLRHTANVDEALNWMAAHRVVGPSGVAGFHWALADPSGRSVVVEYIRGEQVVWENTPRVMTNDPPLDWHWRNLNAYVSLSPNQPLQNAFLSVETSVGTVPQPVGHGYNLGGLPGDATSASRYVQLFYLRGYALKNRPPKTTDDGIVLATGLLNKVFITAGTVAHEDSRFDRPEYVPFALVKVPFERRLLVRGYRNMRWREVDLSRVDFTQSRSWPVDDGTLGVEDLLAGGSVGDQPTVAV